MDVTDREMLAVFKSATFFRHHLDGAQVLVSMDHESLPTIFASREFPYGHRGRWLAKLQQFDIKLRYRQGTMN